MQRPQSIKAGEFHITDKEQLIETVLGSCISACVRDPITKIGGMNHFLLPVNKNVSEFEDTELSMANRYGNFAMENLVNGLLRLGAKRSRLEFKIFGGGRVIKSMTNVGWYNIGFTYDYCLTEGFSIVAQDVGDVYPRKISFNPVTGKVVVKRLPPTSSAEIERKEESYCKDLSRKDVVGAVELF